jgi:hypothetical protein
MKRKILQATFAVLLGVNANAQVNSGSNGSDGAFNPTTNIVINMADHPNGIYQYTSVNIPTNVTVTFIPNANNTPVVWLVQTNCVINGTVDVSAETVPWQFSNPVVQNGGPGGFRGGNGGTSASSGLGPGGGNTGDLMSAHASFGTTGEVWTGAFLQEPAGLTYGNEFLLPLVGGSGGGGKGGQQAPGPGGGGGGAILIAASGLITVNGSIAANGSHGGNCVPFGYGDRYGGSGAGSGGAIRLVASHIAGSGSITAKGGGCYHDYFSSAGSLLNSAGAGRVRFDSPDNNFGGNIGGAFTQGYQPIIIQTNGQGAQLTITSVGGVPVSASPSGQLVTPDAVLSAQQNNPISVVVHCSNIPLNTQITVSVKPVNGAAVSATALNNTGTLASSTATVSITMPRGGGIIYATAAN